MLHPSRLLLTAALPALLFVSCATDSATRADADAGPEAKAEREASEAADLEHAIHIAELDLEKARVETEGAVSAAATRLEVARLEAQEVELSAEAFAAEREVKLDEARLALDRSAGRAKDAELELAELEAMYADEEFAEKTKELVITRGRREMEFAQRALELAQRRLERLQNVELPEKARAIETKRIEAAAAVESAERAMRVAELSRALGLAKAEKALEDARKKKADGADA